MSEPIRHFIIDGHAHLEQVEDPIEAAKRAGAQGVSGIIAVGSDRESNRRVLELSGRHGDTTVYPALGIHPSNLHAAPLEGSLPFIEENMGMAVAVGEIGLDYWIKEARKDPSEKTLQQELFRNLLALCERYNKPAIVHARGSWKESLDLLVEAGVRKAVFHWYSGPLDILERLLDHGYYISATPAAAYSRHHRQAVSKTPLDRLLLETDAPVPFQGKKSEPLDVLLTLEAVAEIKGAGREEVAKITTRNALALFNLAGDP